jgi:Pvc16 N-terminal domain
LVTTIQTTIQRLLYEHGQIDPDEVDVRFDRPSRQWAESLMLPTINLFLFDIVENNDRRNGAPQVGRSSGQAQIRVPARRFDLRYMVGVFTTLMEDETTLLWRALATLLRHNPLPDALLSDELRALDLPLHTQIGQPENGAKPHELFGALDIPPRPTLVYSVTAPLDLEVIFGAPLVLSRSIRFTRPTPAAERAGMGLTAEHAPAFDAMLRIGGIVRNQHGQPIYGATLAVEGSATKEVLTNDEGRFSMRVRRDEPLALRITDPGGKSRLVHLEIPSASYDVILD